MAEIPRIETSARETPTAVTPAENTGRSTVTIGINGAAREVVRGLTVTDLVGELTGRRIAANGQAIDGKRLGVAVARNGDVVPRSQWNGTVLDTGDTLEIIAAAQGG